jgi:hypothetical protein
VVLFGAVLGEAGIRDEGKEGRNRNSGTVNNMLCKGVSEMFAAAVCGK